MTVAALTSQLRRSAAHPLFAAAAIAGMAIALLAGAYAFQYLGGLKPCPLCLGQRVPWFVLIALGGAIAGVDAVRAPRGAVVALYVLAFGVALYGAYLGGYHAGVEYRWWPGPADCTGDAISLPTDGGLLGGLSAAEVVRCDEIAWAMFGISLAGFNFLFSLVAAALAAIGARAVLRKAPR